MRVWAAVEMLIVYLYTRTGGTRQFSYLSEQLSKQQCVRDRDNALTVPHEVSVFVLDFFHLSVKTRRREPTAREDHPRNDKRPRQMDTLEHVRFTFRNGIKTHNTAIKI